MKTQTKLDSIIFGCGLNDFGQLGLKDPSLVTSPTGISLPNKAERIHLIVSGETHSVFLSKYGELYFVGQNLHQIVEGKEEDIHFLPKLVSSDGFKVVSIALNQHQTLFLTEDKKILACRKNLAPFT